MTFTQHVGHCPDESHGPCTVIWCDTDADLLHEDGTPAHPTGTVLWHSHMHADVHAEHRINPGHPAVDHRDDSDPAAIAPSPPCAACAPHFPGGA
jgi:hypothetical protein